jgi:molecular chaperone Hsp33
LAGSVNIETPARRAACAANLTFAPQSAYSPLMMRKALNDPALERHLSTLAPDGVTWFSLGPSGSAIQMRGVLIHGSRAVCQARANHGLGPLETLLLGKGLLCTGLMAALLKDPGSLMLRIDGAGPAEGMSAEGMLLPSGAIGARGRLFKRPLPAEALAAESPIDLFGPGALTVTRIEGDAKPFVGSVALRTGNLNKDLTYYFYESEQTRTAIDSGVYFSKEGAPYGAGALLLQSLPGADDAFVASVEDSLASLPPLGLWFSEGGTRDGLIAAIFGSQGAARTAARTAEAGFAFDCPCSGQRFLDHIARLDRAIIADILERGPWPLETHCHYCSSTYAFTKPELEAALANQRGAKPAARTAPADTAGPQSAAQDGAVEP